MRKAILFCCFGITFLGMTTPVLGLEESELEALYSRLNQLEAEQAKYKATIESLREEVQGLSKKAEEQRPVGKPEQTQQVASVPTPKVAAEKAQPPSTAGPEKHSIFPELANESQFMLKSEDGEFSFGIDGFIATRFEYNHREDDGTGSSDDSWGFENTATRLNFRGSVYEDIGYWARVNADSFGDPVIDAAMIIWHINENTNLVAGQFPNLLTREQGAPVDWLQTAESSPTNFTFDQFAYKGVMVGYHTPRVIYRGIINDGYRSTNNSFFEEPSAEWAVAGQVVGMAVGDESDFARFNDFTSRPGSDFAWQLSAGIHLQEGDDNLEPNGDGSDDLSLGILESSMEGDGWNLYVAGYYRDTEGPTTSEISYKDMGFVLQGGAWVSTHFEAYSRFDITLPDDDRPTENEDFRTLTGGFAFYPYPYTNNFKINTEVLYMFDAEAESIVGPNVNSSVRASPEDDQWVFRTQASLRW